MRETSYELVLDKWFPLIKGAAASPDRQASLGGRLERDGGAEGVVASLRAAPTPVEQGGGRDDGRRDTKRGH